MENQRFRLKGKYLWLGIGLGFRVRVRVYDAWLSINVLGFMVKY
jgi:hypothetical protein